MSDENAFKDADEVYQYIGAMFETATKAPDFVEATKGGNLVILIKQTKPDAAILVDFPNQTVKTGDEALAGTSTVQLRMSSDNANKFWQGKLNFTLAMARRQVKLDGKRSVALKLLPLTEGLFDTYKQRLKDGGREDLLLS